MKPNFLQLSIFILTLFIGTSLSAQDKIIQGLVTTFDSISIIGAEVQVKSTKQIVKTDTLGRFTVAVNQNDKLKVKAGGFITETVKLEENTKLVAVNLKLKPGEKAKEYAIGYGYVKDADKLNAIVQMTNKDADFSQYATMQDLIKGRFAGVQVRSNGEIIIRGTNSFNASNAALIVVDGVPSSSGVLESIAPANVKSINIMKDGSAAIYGSRGSNGVVLIETKRGGDE